MKRKIGFFATLLLVCMAFQSVKAQENKENAQDKTAQGKEILVTVDEYPKFPGGREAFEEFLAKNVQYPEEARNEKVQGIVIVAVVVEIDGSFSDVKVVRGIEPSLDEEALRVVNLMPNYVPAKHEGEEVRVQYYVPVEFALDEE